MEEIFDAARVLLCFTFLSYASWSDFKNREVSNSVWAVFAPLGFALTSLQVYMLSFALKNDLFLQLICLYGLSFVVTLIASVILFYAGAFGGADAKALICISIVLPAYPVYLLTPQSGFVPPLFPISTFSNAVLFASLSVVYNVAYNYLWQRRNKSLLFSGLEKEPRRRKILAFLCGYRVEADELEKKEYLYPLEDIVVTSKNKNGRRLILVPKDEQRVEIVRRLIEATRQGRIEGGVWVTPGLPLIIFITIGFVATLIFGDIVWFLVGSALGMV